MSPRNRDRRLWQQRIGWIMICGADYKPRAGTGRQKLELYAATPLR